MEKILIKVDKYWINKNEVSHLKFNGFANFIVMKNGELLDTELSLSVLSKLINGTKLGKKTGK